MSFKDLLLALQILIAATLVFLLLLQVKGSGFGQALGGAAQSFRTRRGLEKTLFQLTIVLAALFLLVASLSVRAA